MGRSTETTHLSLLLLFFIKHIPVIKGTVLPSDNYRRVHLEMQRDLQGRGHDWGGVFDRQPLKTWQVL